MPDRPTLNVLIQRLHDSRDLQLPTRMSEMAAGFDVRAAVPQPLILRPGQIALVPCGFALSIPPGYEAQLRPRSGLASRQGITLINAPGTIDADYRGEVKAALINLGPEPFQIERGLRIAQMVFAPVPPVELVEVESLDQTGRGAGGFGHTGRGNPAG